MPYKEFQENWETFSNLLQQLKKTNDLKTSMLIKQCLQQNISVLNDILETSIAHLKKLQEAKTQTDIICIQAKFTYEITHRLTLSGQRLLNNSLGNLADYNEWVKTYCDFSTD